ncbi:MAG: alpha/beta fold hydrolase [Acidobacteriota bacterium]
MKPLHSIIIIAAFNLSIFAQGTKLAHKIDLKPCEIAGAEENKKENVLCGTYEVFEDRAAKNGRKIALKIVVFPATTSDKAEDAVFYIAGGPGSSAIEEAPYAIDDFVKVREHRDLVFVDQRGTGGSNPLNCEFFDAADPQSYLGHWNPLDKVRACRQQLELKADLRLYVTTIAMDDLDEVRAALGYDKIDLVAGSYGTRASQAYIRQHGEHVRTAVLQGISVPDQSMPRDFPEQTERALDGVIDECAADKDCHAAFPVLRTDAKALLDKLIKGPVEVEIKYPENGDKTVKVKLSRDLAAEAIRYMLYGTSSSGRIPLFLHLAAQGNFVPLAQAAVDFRKEIVGTGGTGLYLSVTCAEDLPWIAKGAGEGERDEKTFLGTYRLRQQREACTAWPRGEVSRSYFEPVRSNVPTLLLTGQWDPVTPPMYAERLARTFPNSRNLVIPSGGHGFGGLEGLDCITKLTTDLIVTAKTAALDVACVSGIHRKSFLLKMGEK